MRLGKPDKDGLCAGALVTKTDFLRIIKQMKKKIKEANKLCQQ